MDELEPLRRLGADLPRPDTERTRRIKTALTDAIHAEHSGDGSVGVGGRARGRWALAGVAVTAALALGLALAGVLPSDRGGAESAAAQALHEASTTAARQPADAAPTAGQYVYTKSEAAHLEIHPGWTVLVPVTREIWVSPDDSGRIVETRGQPRFLSQADRMGWEAAGSPNLESGKTTDEHFRAQGSPEPGTPVVAGSPEDYLAYRDLSELPTDPDALRQLIEERKVEGGPPGDAQTFTIIGDLLRETYTSPALRSALYQIASELPGVELVGEVKDPAGREGIAVAYTEPQGIRHELIFDQQTSALLGERDVLVDPATAQLSAPSGTIIGYAAYLASGVVDSSDARPGS
jgi:hypothetical protein